VTPRHRRRGTRKGPAEPCKAQEDLRRNVSPEATLFRIRWSTPADLSALTDVYVRASLSNEGDRDALLAHPEALVLEGDASPKG